MKHSAERSNTQTLKYSGAFKFSSNLLLAEFSRLSPQHVGQLRLAHANLAAHWDKLFGEVRVVLG